MYTLKRFRKNSIKHENRGPPRFSHYPQTPSKEFENDCASMDVFAACNFGSTMFCELRVYVYSSKNYVFGLTGLF